VTRRIRLLVAGLGIATAAVTAPTLTTGTPPDTTWGAPDTTTDTTWGNPPTDTGDGENTPVRPADTTWG
jgi:hypothetical protein